MSGGSYDYLYCRDFNLDLPVEDIEKMMNRLEELEYGRACSTTFNLLLFINRFQKGLLKKQEELNEVWKAVEWYDSGDISKEDMEKVLKKFEGDNEKG